MTGPPSRRGIMDLSNQIRRSERYKASLKEAGQQPGPFHSCGRMVFWPSGRVDVC